MLLDGNPIDMATIMVAFISALIRPLKRWVKGVGSCFVFNNLVVDFLNGTVIVPFSVLIGAVFSSGLLAEALKSNKVFMATGGVIGLLFVLREYFNGN